MRTMTQFAWLVLVALAAAASPGAPQAQAGRAQATPSGMTAAWSLSGRPELTVQSAGRYDLRLDRHGIAAWYDLRADPERRHNLVAPATRLLDHRVEGRALDTTPVVVSSSLLRVQVRWQGTTERGQPFSIEYTIWAGGQIDVETQGTPAPSTALRRGAGAATGAALDVVQQSDTREQLILYLSAWTGEHGRGGVLHLDALQPQRAAHGLAVTLAEGMVRQPRFVIAGWGSDQVAIRRKGVMLVAGQDYLAEYQAASATLTVQYLGLLPADASPAERTFEFAERGAMALSLGISGRTLDETSGLLVVDANLPSAEAPSTPTTQDIFRIPYIQSTSELHATAATQGAPPGSGVQFVLDGVAVATVFGASASATIALTPGEHRLDGYIVDSSGRRLSAQPDDSIAQIGYGRIVVAIGDSLTAGKNGFRVNADGNGVGPGPYTYPIGVAADSPGASADGRNFYQLDNYLVGTGALDSYYRGYELRLSELLAQCGDAPVFILNDGLSGSLAGYQRDTNNDRYVSALSMLSRVDAYNSHIAQLGAQSVLLLIGANDASNHVADDDWNDSVAATVDGLAADQIWIAHVPWRADSEANRQLVQSYNSRLPALVATLAGGGRQVREGPDFYAYLAANQGLFDPAVGGDELHPNQDGLDGMADLWAASVCGELPPLGAAPDDRRRISLPLVVR